MEFNGTGRLRPAFVSDRVMLFLVNDTWLAGWISAGFVLERGRTWKEVRKSQPEARRLHGAPEFGLPWRVDGIRDFPNRSLHHSERPAPVGRALRQGNPSGRDRPLPRAIQTLARLLSEEEGRPKLVMHNVRGLRVAERSG
jgi:hypothetical protein